MSKNKGELNDSPFMIYINVYCDDCEEVSECINPLMELTKERNEQIYICSKLRNLMKNKYD